MRDSNATPELLLVPTYILHTPFFGPKNNIVYEVRRNACSGKIFEIALSSIRKGRQNIPSKAYRRKCEFIRGASRSE